MDVAVVLELHLDQSGRHPVVGRLRSDYEIADLTIYGTAGAVFQLPVWAISFLSKKRKGGAGNAQPLRKARELAVVSTKSSAN